MLSSLELERKTAGHLGGGAVGSSKAVNLSLHSLTQVWISRGSGSLGRTSEMIELGENDVQFQKVIRQNWLEPFQASHATYAGGA